MVFYPKLVWGYRVKVALNFSYRIVFDFVEICVIAS